MLGYKFIIRPVAYQSKSSRPGGSTPQCEAPSDVTYLAGYCRSLLKVAAERGSKQPERFELSSFADPIHCDTQGLLRYSSVGAPVVLSVEDSGSEGGVPSATEHHGPGGGF